MGGSWHARVAIRNAGGPCRIDQPARMNSRNHRYQPQTHAGMYARVRLGRGRRAPRPPATEFPQCTVAERRTDAAVHVIGLAMGFVACVALGVAMTTRAGDLREVVALGLYAGIASFRSASAKRGDSRGP